MENITKNPGLRHIIEDMLVFLDKKSIASFRILNQDCKKIVENPTFCLKKLSQTEKVPKNLITKWKKTIQDLNNASETILQDLALELFKMYCYKCPKYPLELVYDLGEAKLNPNLAMAILESSDPDDYVKAKEPKNGNLRPVHLAAYLGYLETLKKIIKTCTTPNPPDELGITPILLASQEGHILKWLNF